jgi:hypothetical protein
MVPAERDPKKAGRNEPDSSQGNEKAQEEQRLRRATERGCSMGALEVSLLS